MDDKSLMRERDAALEMAWRNYWQMCVWRGTAVAFIFLCLGLIVALGVS